MGVNAHNSAFAPPPASNGKISLQGLTLPELTDVLVGLGLEKFRAKQIWNWLYARGVSDFAAMTTLAKPLRERLAEICDISRPQVLSAQKSEDDTQKWLLKFPDGQAVEAVHIPEEDRGTLCISSQVGCTLTCRFCHTGTQKLVRNLSAAEILGQVLYARDQLKDWPDTAGALPKDWRMISNIVLMGMGEPLYNYDNVAKALKIMMDESGIAISKRKITLSTSGVVPMMERCGRELNVNLAVSLHAVNDELRDQIVPLNRKYPIKDLLNACRNYPGLTNARRITFEYVMLKGVNDSDADARELCRLLKNIPAKVNLIPFNPWPGAQYECSDEARIEAFGDIVNAAGYASPVRTPRGRDILAACGQLKTDSLRQTAAERAAERAAMDAVIAAKDAVQGLV